MILFHGTNIEINEIDLGKCRPYKDFGKGFYTTKLPEQAEKMAKRVARIYGGLPVVNMFEIADDFMNIGTLNILNFGNIASERWAKFVMNNRSRTFKDYASIDCNSDCKYDIVAGPVADDDMTMLFRQYQNNMISFEMLVSGITFKEVTSQYSFHTNKAVELLKKVGVM